MPRAMDIKAAEKFEKLRYFKKSQRNDCKKPIKIPTKGAKRAILLNVGLINGN